MSRLFGLILWFRDEPITGNVINLTSIRRPRKEPTDYIVGEVVCANCHGFGVCEGILARIEEEDKQKQLKALLGNDFCSIVEEFKGSIDSLLSVNTESSSPCKQVKVSEPKKAKSKKLSKSGKGPTEERHNDTVTEKAKSKKRPSGVVTVTEKKNLEKAAADLELAEIQSAVDNRANSSTAALVGESLQLLTQQATPEHQQTPNYDQQIEFLSQRLNMYEQRLVNCENHYQWLWSAYREVCNNMQNSGRVSQASEPVAVPSTSTEDVQQISFGWQSSGTVRQAVEPVAVPSTSTEDVQQVSFGWQSSGTVRQAVEPVEVCSDSTEEVQQIENRTYNGYTVEQLKAKIFGIKDFSKASKLLFRTLYSEIEYRGKSLSGKKSNKHYIARPPIAHQERLDILYRIITEVFPSVTPPMIRLRLRDLVKPSRQT